MIQSFRCKHTRSLFEGGDPSRFRAFKDSAMTNRPINQMRPVHPGEILREDFLVPLNMSVNALALALKVPPSRIHEIVKERRSISADTAERLARFFGGDAASWLNLQAIYDLKTLPNRDEIIQRIQPRISEQIV